MAEHPKPSHTGYRVGRAIEPVPLFQSHARHDLGGGVLVAVGRFEPYGDWGFRASLGLERIQGSDCAWDEEMARAIGTKAAIVRFIEGRPGLVPIAPDPR